MDMQKGLIVLLWLCCAWSASAQRAQTWLVNDHRVECEQLPEQGCIQVKQKTKEPWKAWAMPIEGFTFVPGYSYKLKVQVKPVYNPTTETTGDRYFLKKVVKQTKTNFDPATYIYDKDWFLTTLWDDTTYINLLDTNSVFFNFNKTENRLSGKGICNRFTGRYQITGDSLNVSQVSSTKMACEGVQFEQVLLGLIQHMARYTVTPSRLVLYSSDRKQRMIFRK